MMVVARTPAAAQKRCPPVPFSPRFHAIILAPLRVVVTSALLVVAVVTAGSGGLLAQEARFFQLGTGPSGESRFPVGGLVASALSNPPGSRDCDKGGSCGVPGLVAVAKSTSGSAANIDALVTGRLDAALVHADMAWWAAHGAGPYKGRPAVTSLRAVASLYRANLHLVVRQGAGIAQPADLRGKRLALGEADGEAAAQGQLLLAALGLNGRKVKLSFLKPAAAAEALAQGQVDAVLMVEADPVPLLADLIRGHAARLVPLAGPLAEGLVAQNPFMMASVIAAGTYAGQDLPVPTLGVDVVLVTDAAQPAALVGALARALTHPVTRRMLDQANPRGIAVVPDLAAPGRLGLVLHDGVAPAR